MALNHEGDAGTSQAWLERALEQSLDRIARSPQFANSPRLQRLLRYLVERSFSDDRRALQEFTIGVEVFDRDGNFDPGHDTIVRVTACRLRRRLADYYASAGDSDPVQFSLPKGHYEVNFKWPSATAQRLPLLPRAQRNPALSWPAAAGLALAIALSFNVLYFKGSPSSGFEWVGARDSSALADVARGQHLFNRRGPGDVLDARTAFQQALASDPQLVPAWVGLAGSLRILALDGRIDYEESLSHQQTALTAALSLEPEHAEANVRMARLQQLLGNTVLSREYFRTAIRHGSDSALVQSIAAGIARRQGDLAEAIRLQRQAATLEPLSAIAHANLGHYLYQAGHYGEALAQLSQARILSPALVSEFNHSITKILLLQGRYTEAESFLATMPPGPGTDQLATLLHDVAGRHSSARRALQSLVGRDGREATLLLAEVYAFREDPDAAINQVLRWYRMTLDWRENDYLAACDAWREAIQNPFLASLHENPRWQRWTRELDSVLTNRRTAEAQWVTR